MTDRDDGRRSGQRLCDAVRLPLQISCDRRKLRECGFEVFDDFLRDNARIGEVGAVFEAFVFEPENIEVEFVALG